MDVGRRDRTRPMTYKRNIAVAVTAAISLGAALQGQGRASAGSYETIDGGRLKTYVEAQTAMSRAYRDHGHPQFWGRIIGTESDAESARWLTARFNALGLVDVHEQPFDLPPQWMPQSWSITAMADSKTLELTSAQPTYSSAATPPSGLDLEAVEVGFASDADLARQDLRGKAVVFYSTDFHLRDGTISDRAFKRITDKGAAAIFATLLIPGNMHFQFYPSGSTVPTFALGKDDGLKLRDAIAEAGTSGARAHVRVALNVSMAPHLKSSTVWGTLPGATDETVFVMAHRDGWFESANDNASGVAVMVGLAEYFAKIPKAQRRRTIVFVGTNGHHNSTSESVVWLEQHPETFSKTALLINCEHVAANVLVTWIRDAAGTINNVVQPAAEESPKSWFIGGSPKLSEIVTNAYRTFDVKLLARASQNLYGEAGRLQKFAPSMQLIDQGLYWHSEKETDDLIPATGLQSVTRAYAKIITDTGVLSIAELRRPERTGQ